MFEIATDLASQTNGDKLYFNTTDTGSTYYISVDDASKYSGISVVAPASLLVAVDESGNATFTGQTIDLGGLWETTPTIEEGDNVGVSAASKSWYLTMVASNPNQSTQTSIDYLESPYGLWRTGLLDDTSPTR